MDLEAENTALREQLKGAQYVVTATLAICEHALVELADARAQLESLASGLASDARGLASGA